jgi:PAN domain
MGSLRHAAKTYPRCTLDLVDLGVWQTRALGAGEPRVTLGGVFELLWSVVQSGLPGKGDQLAAIIADPRVLLVCFTTTLLSIAVALFKHRKYAGGSGAMLLAAGLGGTYAVVATSGFDLHAGRVFIGGDLRSLTGAGNAAGNSGTLDACQQICIADMRCVGFTYDSVLRACHPKAEIRQMHSLSSAISGIKRGAPPAK